MHPYRYPGMHTYRHKHIDTYIYKEGLHAYVHTRTAYTTYKYVSRMGVGVCVCVENLFAKVSIFNLQGDTACHWDCVQRSYQ